MLTHEEIERIINWCEQLRKDKKTLSLIERNPFGKEIPWTEKFSFIYIDFPRERVPKNSLVYDSELHAIWYYTFTKWMPIFARVETKIK